MPNILVRSGILLPNILCTKLRGRGQCGYVVRYSWTERSKETFFDFYCTYTVVSLARPTPSAERVWPATVHSCSVLETAHQVWSVIIYTAHFESVMEGKMNMSGMFSVFHSLTPFDFFLLLSLHLLSYCSFT